MNCRLNCPDELLHDLRILVDEEGRATVQERASRPALPVVLESRLICDYEAQVDWVLGVSSPNRFRVLELADPTRLTIDIRHH